MKFPLVADAFGHTKVIHEIRGNATGSIARRPRSQARRGQAISTMLTQSIPQPMDSLSRLQS